MELNDAISHAREVAKEIRQANEEMPNGCKLSKDLCECATEHEQLAEWLEELKDYRAGNGRSYNPSGDLISRTELKKCAIPCQIHNGALTELCVPLYQIDNAPTVDIKDQIAGAYNEGYMCGSREAEKARPQGEYIRVDNLWAKCSICGNLTRTIKKYNMPNFCPACGARMEGDKK